MHALALFFAAAQALRIPGPLSPRNASYRIEATLDPQAHTVTAHERITWKNLAPCPASELTFHLYMNAFKNESSTFMRESHGHHRRSSKEAHGWGAIDVSKLVVAGKDLTASLRVDDTLGTVALPAQVAPGATVEIEVSWKVLLPKVFARTGYHDDFYAVAQWFPKLGVFDAAPHQPNACVWRAHQHHLNSEFFADYGVYDVAFTAPERFHLAATGVAISETHASGQHTVTYHAEDVHDFVVAASPHFQTYEETVPDAWGGIRVVLYSLPGHEANVPRHLAAAKVALDLLERRFGVYPYSQLSVVDVPEGGEGAGGMEYPTLVFTIGVPSPRGVHIPELVTIHEIAHQFFYGIVGSDEVEEAWLDEGLTETVTDLGLSQMFGRARAEYDLFGHHLSHTALSRLEYRRRAGIDPIETRSFDFLDNASYGTITYAKTDVVMRTLEGLLGPERFFAGWRRYATDWRFRHPREADFVRSFDAGTGEDLGWFWKDALDSVSRLDYEVLSIESREKRAPAGLFDGPGGRKEVAPEKRSGGPYTSEVVVHRRGDFVFPVELKVVFEGGSVKRERWDGGRADGRTWRRFTYEGNHKVAWATVDPDGKVPLDLSRWNDGLRRVPDASPRHRIAAGFASAVSSLLSLVGF